MTSSAKDAASNVQTAAATAGKTPGPRFTCACNLPESSTGNTAARHIPHPIAAPAPHSRAEVGRRDSPISARFPLPRPEIQSNA